LHSTIDNNNTHNAYAACDHKLKFANALRVLFHAICVKVCQINQKGEPLNKVLNKKKNKFFNPCRNVKHKYEGISFNLYVVY